MTKKDFKAQFPFLYATSQDYIELYLDEKHPYYKGNKYKTEKGYLNFLKREEEAIAEKLSAPLPTLIEIDVEWKRSRTWGNNPYAEVRVWTKDGFFGMFTDSASGCGYDKLSAAVAGALNQCARQLLWNKRKQIKKAPYGVNKNLLNFEGGVGIECYRRITEWLGGTWTEDRRAKSYDYFEMRFTK